MTPLPRRALAGSDAEIMVPGEFALTRDDFRRITSIVHKSSGISMPESKAALVYARLTKRLRTLHMRAFRDYCALVELPSGRSERDEMLAALTTNVTRFYREPHHFEHMKTKLLPKWIEIAKRGGKIRIWSSACSTGQEPYSIALTILSFCPDATKYDIHILASDIDPNVLTTAKAGLYADHLVTHIPQDLLRRFFTPTQHEGKPHFQANDTLKKLITFRQMNLIEPWPIRDVFDAIFCRNVVIYFEEETRQRLWQNFMPRLADGGAFYIGHSERVSGPATDLVVRDGITTYKKLGTERT